MPAPLHRLQLARLPLPANSTTRMSIVAAKTMRAHTMNSTATETKEPAMPAGEESHRTRSTSQIPAPALASALYSSRPSTSWPAPACTLPPMRTTCSTRLSPTTRPHHLPLTMSPRAPPTRTTPTLVGERCSSSGTASQPVSTGVGSGKSLLVREKGLEPSRPKAPGPKTGASTNSATRAARCPLY